MLGAFFVLYRFQQLHLLHLKECSTSHLAKKRFSELQVIVGGGLIPPCSIDFVLNSVRIEVVKYVHKLYSKFTQYPYFAYRREEYNKLGLLPSASVSRKFHAFQIPVLRLQLIYVRPDFTAILGQEIGTACT